MERNLRIPASVDLDGYIRVLLKIADNVRDAGDLYTEEILNDYEEMADLINRKDRILTMLQDEMSHVSNEIQKYNTILIGDCEDDEKAEVAGYVKELSSKYDTMRAYLAMLISRFDAFEENFKKFDRAVRSFAFENKAYAMADSLNETASKMQTFTDWVDSVQWGYQDV